MLTEQIEVFLETAADDQPSDQCTGRRMGIKIIYPDEQRASSDAGRYDHAGMLSENETAV